MVVVTFRYWVGLKDVGHAEYGINVYVLSTNKQPIS